METEKENQVTVFEKKDIPLIGYPVMEEIRRLGKLCDVTLKVEDEKFTAHKLVLAASIPYFHAMFTHDMVESRQNEITIHGIEPDALEALVNFAYSGKIQISVSNVQSLLVGASFLQLTEVTNACCDFLNARLHPNNCLGIRAFADSLMCSDLVNSTNKFIGKHFLEVSRSEEFLRLSKSDVVEIISGDELFVSSEEQVFETVLRWVKFDISTRKSFMPELLARVRMPLLSPQYLTDHVATEELVKTCHRCRDLLDEAKDYHLMPERRQLLQSFRTRPRCCNDIVGAIYAVGGLTSSGDSLSTVESFDPIVRKWEVAQAMSTLRSRVGVGVLLGKLYAIGGYNGQERLSTVEVFELSEKKWKQVAPMNTRRSALGVAALDGELYVCGGYDGVSSLSSVERYNPATNMWTHVAYMVKHRSAAGVTVLGGQVYVLGGHDGLSIFDSVECYSKTTDSWSNIPSMQSKRCRLGVASLNGKIYACGGYDGASFLRTVERFDMATQTWTYVAPMNVKRSRVALVANCGKLYAIGGYDGVSNLNSVEVYNLETDTWKFEKPMCAHVGGVGVGVVPLVPTREFADAQL